MMRFKQRRTKVETWRIELWKSIIDVESKSFIDSPDNPNDQRINDYAAGFNDGMLMARSWYAKYVEGGAL